jgi:hypothetical protein
VWEYCTELCDHYTKRRFIVETNRLFKYIKMISRCLCLSTGQTCRVTKVASRRKRDILYILHLQLSPRKTQITLPFPLFDSYNSNAPIPLSASSSNLKLLLPSNKINMMLLHRLHVGVSWAFVQMPEEARQCVLGALSFTVHLWTGKNVTIDCSLRI